MITKISSRLTPNIKQPIRANLQKTAIAGLAVLAGSSMSGWNTPEFVATQKVIPGGLDLREKAYFLLKGKMPQSVIKRWETLTNDYTPKEGDQVVTVNIGDGIYIGKILEAPHKIGTTAEPVETLNTDISENIISAVGEESLGDFEGGDEEMSKIDILRRFLGQY